MRKPIEERSRRLDDLLSRDRLGLARVARLYGGRDAENLYQDILAALWVALARFRGESSLRTFAYRIAHNRGASFRSDRLTEPLLTEPVSASELEDEVLQREQHQRLLKAMRRLPMGIRQVLALSLEGFSYKEIAVIAGISANNVGVRINRAKRALKEAFENDTG